MILSRVALRPSLLSWSFLLAVLSQRERDDTITFILDNIYFSFFNAVRFLCTPCRKKPQQWPVFVSLSDLLQNLNLTLHDVALVREIFHELLVSAAKHSHEHSYWIWTYMLTFRDIFNKNSCQCQSECVIVFPSHIQNVIWEANCCFSLTSCTKQSSKYKNRLDRCIESFFKMYEV